MAITPVTPRPRSSSLQSQPSSASIRPMLVSGGRPDSDSSNSSIPDSGADYSPATDYIPASGTVGRIYKLSHDGKKQHVTIQLGSPSGKPKDGDSDTSSLDSTDTLCTCPSPLQHVMLSVEVIQRSLGEFCRDHNVLLTRLLYFVLFALFFAYFLWAVIKDAHRAMSLIVTVVLLAIWAIISLLWQRFGEVVSDNLLIPLCDAVDRAWFILKWCVWCVLGAAVVVVLVVVVRPHPRQLISLAGLAVFLTLTFLFSKHPGKVRWRPVVWGVGLQFTLGVVILQTASGLQFFHWLGRQVQAFLAFSDYGARFVFGQTFHDHFFAFSILPVVVFFSAVIQVLYHLGVMQVVIRGIAWVMQKTMHTAATESLIAASNIFIGQTEAPILIRPFVADMTKSELHSMMTTGFATIAGGVLAAYIRFGVPAEHLLCASVMNAPVALAVSKLSYPETEKSSTANGQISFEKSPDRSVIEAASAGASASISLVANIAANLLAFLALLAFINAGVSWAGSLVDHPEWTFQLLCSYVFMPVAFLMGVDWQDCRHVAELLGVKIFLNEFVAYQELGVYIENREKGLQPQISVRSATIATYALCGFANLSSIGCQLGGIGPMAPARKGDLAALAVRALVAGTTACFITACVAGILTTEDTMPPCVFNSSTIINSTSCLLSSMQNSTLPIT